MQTETFRSKLKALRDRGQPPQLSFLLRHGNSFLGTTFHLWALPPIELLDLEDVEWSLLAAAKEAEVTDLQLHFRCKTDEDPNKFLNRLLEKILRSGFKPMSVTFVTKQNKGFIRFPLFEAGDMPRLNEFLSTFKEH